MDRVCPMLAYEDVAAACDWLGRAFGFAVREQFRDDDGRVTHAILEVEGHELHAGWPGPHYRSPRSHVQECEVARRMYDNPYVIDGVLVLVDDLDAHLARARAAGAEIVRGPADGPAGRLYTAADLEGHRWMFEQSAESAP